MPLDRIAAALADLTAIVRQQQDILLRLVDGKSQAVPHAASAITVKELWDGFAQAHAHRGWVRHMKGSMARVISTLGHMPASELTPEVWAAYCQQRSDLQPVSRNQLLKGVRAMCKWGVRTEKLLRDPMDGVRRERQKRRRRTVWSEEDEKRYLQSADPHLRLMYTLGVEAGLRRSEAVKARMEWLDLGVGNYAIPGAITKTRRGRLVPLNARAIAAIIEYRKALPIHLRRSPWLFPSPVSKGSLRPGDTHLNPDTLSRASAKLARALGIKGHPDDGHPTIHDTRRTAATRDMRAGATIPAMMAKYGWDNPQEVQTYVVAAEEDAETLRDVRVKQRKHTSTPK